MTNHHSMATEATTNPTGVGRPNRPQQGRQLTIYSSEDQSLQPTAQEIDFGPWKGTFLETHSFFKWMATDCNIVTPIFQPTIPGNAVFFMEVARTGEQAFVTFWLQPEMYDSMEGLFEAAEVIVDAGERALFFPYDCAMVSFIDVHIDHIVAAAGTAGIAALHVDHEEDVLVNADVQEVYLTATADAVANAEQGYDKRMQQLRSQMPKMEELFGVFDDLYDQQQQQQQQDGKARGPEQDRKEGPKLPMHPALKDAFHYMNTRELRRDTAASYPPVPMDPPSQAGASSSPQRISSPRRRGPQRSSAAAAHAAAGAPTDGGSTASTYRALEPMANHTSTSELLRDTAATSPPPIPLQLGASSSCGSSPQRGHGAASLAAAAGSSSTLLSGGKHQQDAVCPLDSSSQGPTAAPEAGGLVDLNPDEYGEHVCPYDPDVFRYVDLNYVFTAYPEIKLYKDAPLAVQQTAAIHAMQRKMPGWEPPLKDPPLSVAASTAAAQPAYEEMRRLDQQKQQLLQRARDLAAKADAATAAEERAESYAAECAEQAEAAAAVVDSSCPPDNNAGSMGQRQQSSSSSSVAASSSLSGLRKGFLNSRGRPSRESSLLKPATTAAAQCAEANMPSLSSSATGPAAAGPAGSRSGATFKAKGSAAAAATADHLPAAATITAAATAAKAAAAAAAAAAAEAAATEEELKRVQEELWRNREDMQQQSSKMREQTKDRFEEWTRQAAESDSSGLLQEELRKVRQDNRRYLKMRRKFMAAMERHYYEDNPPEPLLVRLQLQGKWLLRDLLDADNWWWLGERILWNTVALPIRMILWAYLLYERIWGQPWERYLAE